LRALTAVWRGLHWRLSEAHLANTPRAQSAGRGARRKTHSLLLLLNAMEGVSCGGGYSAAAAGADPLLAAARCHFAKKWHV